MKMVNQGLRPGVQNSDKAQLADKAPFSIFSKELEHLCCGFKQQPQKNTLVAHYQRVQLMGQGKDQMKVAAGQQLGPALIEPFFFGYGLTLGTVPVAARVVGWALVTAMVALLQMASKGRGAAYLDQVQYL
jgi:hypothetical protein